MYDEVHRPRFHFSARQNWHNDPNGLIYHAGRWHLFFQHNPEATVWGNMTWGHAVSDDLVHWVQMEHALYPDEHGTMFSGSAVVDRFDTSGLGEDTLLAFYTAAGSHVEPPKPYTQCLAYSIDSGGTWLKFDENPIVSWIDAHNRDPKVVWHAPTRCWIMALYLTDDRFCLLRSTDAKQWERIQNITLEHDSECPDFFPLLDEAGIERWVFWGGSGTYLIGDFDGALFSPRSEVQTCEHGSNGYAAQTWSNAPSGRCIQISWMAGGRYPEMPFNQQMSFPVELSLRGNNGIWTLCRWPVKEIESITEPLDVPVSVGFDGSKPWPMPVSGDLFDIAFDISADGGGEVVMKIRGIPLTFDFERRVVNFRDSEVPMVGKDHLSVRLLIDRTSVELFLDGGQVSASFCYLPDAYVAPLVFNVRSGTANLDRVRVERVEDIWESVR